MSMIQANRSRRRSNAGFVLAFVLVCIAVTTVALTAMLSRTSLGIRHLRQRQTQLQGRLLTASAVELAMVRLRTDADYSGETWSLSADDIGNGFSGKATISVQPADGPATRLITVVTVYPESELSAVRHESQVIVTMSSEGETP